MRPTRCRPLAEQQILDAAKSYLASGGVTIQGNLTTLGVNISDLGSSLTYSATAVLRDHGGTTFIVFMDYEVPGNNTWNATRLICSYPET